MSPLSKLPARVVLAAVAAGFDLADLFCYEMTETGVLLISNRRGQSVRVSQAQIEAARRPSPPAPLPKGEGRKIGPPPEDTRAQDAPGRAVARPCDDSKE